MEPLNTNRFPIFAVWCYVIARRLGYGVAEAKSLAVTRARLGAAAKAGLLGGGGKKHPAPRVAGAPAAQQPASIDQVPFVGMRPYVTEVDGERRGVMHSGQDLQVITPRQYDSSVTRKLGDAAPAVQHVLEALAAKLPPEALNAEGYRLWERFAPMVRDASGRESKPRFGQRGVFDPAKVERLIAELAAEHRPKAA